MRLLSTTIFAVLFLLLAGPADAQIMGKRSEISLGREMAARVEQDLPVDRDPVATARVRQLGRRLVSALETIDLPYEFHLVDTAEINAFAVPGGFIYVHRGLLQLLPNDDALAFVLAHEISHAQRRHSVKQLEKSLALQVLLGIVGGNIAAGRALEMLLGLKFSRSDEREADRLGLRLMARAGFDPDAAAEAMQVIRRAGGGGGPSFLRTHPAPESRLARLQEEAEEARSERAERRSDAPAPPPLELPALLGAGPDAPPAPCEMFPLAAGAEWRYRSRSEQGESRRSLTVVEALPGEPEGVFRVREELGDAARADWLLAPAGDRLYARPLAGGEWRLEAAFAPSPAAPADLVARGTERVRVPAGEFEALRVDRLDEAGELVSSSWYAPGVGLVKRRFAESGLTEELERYRLPGRSG